MNNRILGILWGASIFAQAPGLKLANHTAAVALCYFSHDVESNHTVEVMPAVAAGVAGHLREMSDLVALVKATNGC